MMAGDSRCQASRAVHVAHDTVEIAYSTRSLLRYGLDPMRASKQIKKQINLCSRLRSKKPQASLAKENKSRTTPTSRADGRARRPLPTRSRSIVERGWQPIAIGHRVDEPGPGANSPVVGMRKLEAWLGFADHCRRRFLDAFGLELLPRRLRRGRRH